MTLRLAAIDDQTGECEIGGVRCKVVPVEPTEAMNTNGASAYENALDDGARWQRAAMYCYRAMLSAAAIDLSGLPVVPERYPETSLNVGGFRSGFNTALDAIGVKG